MLETNNLGCNKKTSGIAGGGPVTWTPYHTEGWESVVRGYLARAMLETKNLMGWSKKTSGIAGGGRVTWTPYHTDGCESEVRGYLARAMLETNNLGWSKKTSDGTAGGGPVTTRKAVSRKCADTWPEVSGIVTRDNEGAAPLVTVRWPTGITLQPRLFFSLSGRETTFLITLSFSNYTSSKIIGNGLVFVGF